jgi:hypothetical protein
MAIAHQKIGGRRPSWQSVALAAIFVVGFALRVLNAWTAVVHPDELHYVGDAAWGMLEPHPSGTLEFLRAHPKPHPRMNPRTGKIDVWEPGGGYDQGHPCLYAYVVGGLFAIVHPTWPFGAIRIGRLLNAAGDAITILLLPPLVLALGYSMGVGLGAALLYALYPPAIAYGSIGNIDPWLAPLLVASLWLVLGADRIVRVVVAGAVAGLLLSEKQTGLVILAVAPIAGLAFGRLRVRDLPIWALALGAVVALLTSPAVYADNVLHPTTTMGQVHWTPFTTLAANVRYLIDPGTYYWLSFTRHGEPLSLFGRPHYFVTPAYMAGFLLAFAIAVARRCIADLVTLWLPVVLALIIIVPTDGLWRFHLASPLLCAGLACQLGRLRWKGRLAIAAAATMAAFVAAAPLEPSADGSIDLGNLLLMNPAVRQVQMIFNERHPFVVQMPRNASLSRLLWLSPGEYDVAAEPKSGLQVSIDGQRVGEGAGRVALRGWLHRLELSAPQGASVRILSIRSAPSTDRRSTDDRAG